MLHGPFPGVNSQRCWDLYFPFWILKQLLRIFIQKLVHAITGEKLKVNLWVIHINFYTLTLIIYFTWFIYHIGHKYQTSQIQSTPLFHSAHANFQNLEMAHCVLPLNIFTLYRIHTRPVVLWPPASHTLSCTTHVDLLKNNLSAETLVMLWRQTHVLKCSQMHQVIVFILCCWLDSWNHEMHEPVQRSNICMLKRGKLMECEHKRDGRTHSLSNVIFPSRPERPSGTMCTRAIEVYIALKEKILNAWNDFIQICELGDLLLLSVYRMFSYSFIGPVIYLVHWVTQPTNGLDAQPLKYSMWHTIPHGIFHPHGYK